MVSEYDYEGRSCSYWLGPKAASLAAPLHADWAALYFWVAARVLARWGKVNQEEDF